MNVLVGCRGNLISKDDVAAILIGRYYPDKRYFYVEIKYKSGVVVTYNLNWLSALFIDSGDGTTTRPHEINNQ